MKRYALLISICLSIVLMTACGHHGPSSSADWAYPFVVWNGDIYEVLNEEIDPDFIDQLIGEVKRYSDVEGTYGNGFSNKYPVGTKLYQLADMKTDECIAVEADEGLYIKAQNRGKYIGGSTVHDS